MHCLKKQHSLAMSQSSNNKVTTKDSFLTCLTCHMVICLVSGAVALSGPHSRPEVFVGGNQPARAKIVCLARRRR